MKSCISLDISHAHGQGEQALPEDALLLLGK